MGGGFLLMSVDLGSMDCEVRWKALSFVYDILRTLVFWPLPYISSTFMCNVKVFCNEGIFCETLNKIK